MKVNATYDSKTIKTDQSVEEGGEGSAPEPFTYFLSSIGTCAGAYILTFCHVRSIPTDGIRILQSHEYDSEKKNLKKIRLDIRVPPDFPKKYHKAIARVANLCTVKKVIVNPPDFDIVTTVEDPTQLP